MPRGQKVSPHHRGRRKTQIVVRTSTIFGADVHDPKGCRKTLYKKVCVFLAPKEGMYGFRFKALPPSPPKTRGVNFSILLPLHFPQVFSPGVQLGDHFSGQVRPRQGTEICNFGAPSPLEALYWIFCFFSSVYVQFSKTSPLKSGESCKKSSGENRVKSCHVCGCHGFLRP